MAANPQDLENEAVIYDRLGPMTTAQRYRIALLRRWLLTKQPGAPTDAQSMINYATPYLDFPVSLADGVELALLDQISQLP